MRVRISARRQAVAGWQRRPAFRGYGTVWPSEGGELPEMVSTIEKISPTGSPQLRPVSLVADALPLTGSEQAGAVAGSLQRNGSFVDHAGGDRPARTCLGRIGTLELRLATGDDDLERAQRLRYNVFYEEMAAQPDALAAVTGRDADAYDAICDHLLVLDHAQPETPEVVGTYRLLRQEVARRHGGFYSATEYAIGPMLEAHPDANVLELGRSCVLAPYRNKRTVELLWQGIWSYVLHHRIDVMLGCASLAGTDPDALALPLSFLAHFARAPQEWQARAHAHLHVPMARIPREAIDPRAALAALPPLIKGYLRLGAVFGDGAVVDRQFGTTDVLVVLPVSRINPRYIAHFGADAGRHA